MGKKSKAKNNNFVDNNDKIEIQPEIEVKFKKLMRIMSWVVGISFTLLIILPNFEFFLVDIIVKFLFFLGLINLILFAILEFFAQNIMVYLSRNKV
jgi:hypothetical protein